MVGDFSIREIIHALYGFTFEYIVPQADLHVVYIIYLSFIKITDMFEIVFYFFHEVVVMCIVSGIVQRIPSAQLDVIDCFGIRF